MRRYNTLPTWFCMSLVGPEICVRIFKLFPSVSYYEDNISFISLTDRSAGFVLFLLDLCLLFTRSVAIIQDSWPFSEPVDSTEGIKQISWTMRISDMLFTNGITNWLKLVFYFSKSDHSYVCDVVIKIIFIIADHYKEVKLSNRFTKLQCSRMYHTFVQIMIEKSGQCFCTVIFWFIHMHVWCYLSQQRGMISFSGISSLSGDGRVHSHSQHLDRAHQDSALVP